MDLWTRRRDPSASDASASKSWNRCCRNISVLVWLHIWDFFFELSTLILSSCDDWSPFTSCNQSNGGNRQLHVSVSCPLSPHAWPPSFVLILDVLASFTCCSCDLESWGISLDAFIIWNSRGSWCPPSLAPRVILIFLRLSCWSVA